MKKQGVISSRLLSTAQPWVPLDLACDLEDDFPNGKRRRPVTWNPLGTGGNVLAAYKSDQPMVIQYIEDL